MQEERDMRMDDHRMDDEVLLTAYALGELEGTEKARIEQRLAGDSELRAELESMQAMASMLTDEFASEAGPGLTDEQRRRVEEASSDATPTVVKRSKLSLVRTWTGVVALAASLLAMGGMWWQMQATARVDVDNLVARRSPEDASSIRSALRGLGYTGDSTESKLAGVGYMDGLATQAAGTDLRALGYTDGSGTGLSHFAVPSRSSQPSSGWRHDPIPNLAFGTGKEQSGRVKRVNPDLSAKLQSMGYAGEESEVVEIIFSPAIENPFILANGQRYSTFSSDVDTASYALLRQNIKNGSPVDPSSVRIEELINYFPYDYAGPTGDEPFAVHVEVTAAPWAPNHRLMRIGIKGRDIPMADRRPSNLVFLLDVSGSMDSPEKLPLLKKALELLVRELGENDRVSIVVYAGAAGVVLPPITCDYKVSILQAIEQLDAGGSTAGGAGIELAYSLAQENFREGGINRVILATDGDWNVGTTDAGALEELIAEKAESGIFLSILGFGMGRGGDERMERLSGRGNGTYAYIDSMLEAQKVLVSELGSTLETIAKDVKLQVEFNPAQVAAYRLIGYENRMLNYEDFEDDKKDAGDIGAGHTVTALYEVIPAASGLKVPGFDLTEIQNPNAEGAPDEQPTTPTALTDEFCQVDLRYKEPLGDTSRLMQVSVEDTGLGFHAAGEDTRFAAAVASFGMLLHLSQYSGDMDSADVRRWVIEALGDDIGGYRAEFRQLVRRHGKRMAKEKAAMLKAFGYSDGESPDASGGR